MLLLFTGGGGGGGGEGKSRRELFDELDRPAITALPTDRFIHGDWSKAEVRLDYHVPVDHHDYSVPYQRATDEVEIRLSASTVEVFYKGKRCASHVRSFEYTVDGRELIALRGVE